MIGRSKELEDVGRVTSSFPTYLGKIEATLLAGYLFSAVHKNRLQEYSKCQAHQTLFKMTHRYKTINKK